MEYKQLTARLKYKLSTITNKSFSKAGSIAEILSDLKQIEHSIYTKFAWPAWCFMPLEVASDYLYRCRFQIQSKDPIDYDNPTSMSLFKQMKMSSIINAWRYTQGVYVIDPTLSKQLSEMPISGNLPVQQLMQFPEWCMYVHFDHMMADKQALGVFYYLDFSFDRTQLNVLVDYDDDCGYPLSIDLDKNLTIEELIEDERRKHIQGLADIKTDDPKFYQEWLAMGRIIDKPINIVPYINILLYILTQQESIHHSNGSNRKPYNPKLTKTKNGLKLLPANHPTCWEVGYRIGAALRKAQQVEDDQDKDNFSNISGSHSSKRAHIRRAHWHSFWIGAKDSADRKLIVKWLHPMLVGDQDEIIPTIKKVG